jgi:hypothetical protein
MAKFLGLGMTPVHTTVPCFLVNTGYKISVRKKETKKHLKGECINGWLYRNKRGYVM